MVSITLHGFLGDSLGKNWKLAVTSVSEAIRAIEILSKRKLYKLLIEQDKKDVKYEVLINGRAFETETPLDINDLSTIRNSELAIQNRDLKTIDIVPIISGANASIGSVIAGVLLIIVGVLVTIGTLGGGGALGAFLIMAGIGLTAAGVINLLSSPPKFDPFQTIGNNNGTPSYIFNGPENTTREGGPVPVGYGRVLIGSQVIAASYNISNIGQFTDTSTHPVADVGKGSIYGHPTLTN